MNREEVYKKASDNGYTIEYGKRHSLYKLYQRRNGTNVYPVVFGGDGEPEYGYDITRYLPDSNARIFVFAESIYDKPAEWEDVVDFVSSL